MRQVITPVIIWTAGAVALVVGMVFLWALFAVAVRAETPWLAVHSDKAPYTWIDRHVRILVLWCLRPGERVLTVTMT